MVNQAADLAAGQGMEQAVAVAQSGTNGFGVISGGSSRYESGSHVDVKSVNLMLGMSHGLNNSAGQLTVGGFVEFGHGGYDSFNSFATRPDVRADGDLRYYGAGALLRQDFNQGAFVEGSLRAGRVRQDYDSADLTTGGLPVQYRRNSSYYGAHLGGGWNIGSFTLSGVYLWTRQGGGNVYLPSEAYRFDAVNSQRLRLGGQYQHALTDNVTFKAGAAWEYEFDGKAKGRVRVVNRVFELDSPSLKGSTGIFSLGLGIKPQANQGWNVDVGVQGYTGKRKGVGGNVRVKYAF